MQTVLYGKAKQIIFYTKKLLLTRQQFEFISKRDNKKTHKTVTLNANSTYKNYRGSRPSLFSCFY